MKKINGMAGGVNTYFGKLQKLIFHKWEVARRGASFEAMRRRTKAFRAEGRSQD
jgi:hypothetical protein